VLRLERGGALTALAREPVSATARVVAADLDGDKAATLVVYEPATGRLSERLAKRKAVDFGSISPLHALFAGDFNGDGRDDLWIQPTAGADPELWLMEAGGGFTVAALRFGRSVSPATIADVNGDGREDLAGYDAARDELRAFLLDGGRVIGERPIAKGPLETLRGGDVDGDGDDDLLTRAPNGEESALLLAR
ncbi:MAG: FG-GAP repeat domain-containing protein, partial [Myxococcota bacterium]